MVTVAVAGALDDADPLDGLMVIWKLGCADAETVTVTAEEVLAAKFVFPL